MEIINTQECVLGKRKDIPNSSIENTNKSTHKYINIIDIIEIIETLQYNEIYFEDFITLMYKYYGQNILQINNYFIYQNHIYICINGITNKLYFPSYKRKLNLQEFKGARTALSSALFNYYHSGKNKVIDELITLYNDYKLSQSFIDNLTNEKNKLLIDIDNIKQINTELNMKNDILEKGIIETIVPSYNELINFSDNYPFLSDIKDIIIKNNGLLNDNMNDSSNLFSIYIENNRHIFIDKVFIYNGFVFIKIGSISYKLLWKNYREITSNNYKLSRIINSCMYTTTNFEWVKESLNLIDENKSLIHKLNVIKEEKEALEIKTNQLQKEKDNNIYELSNNNNGSSQNVNLYIQKINNMKELLNNECMKKESYKAKINTIIDDLNKSKSANNKLSMDNNELTKQNNQLQKSNNELLKQNEFLVQYNSELQMYNNKLTNDMLLKVQYLNNLQKNYDELLQLNKSLMART